MPAEQMTAMDWEFRPAAAEDLAALEEVFAQARRALAESGVDQWQNGYPNTDVLEADIFGGNGWVATCNGKVVGTCAVCFGEDPTYRHIYGGRWHCAGPYAALHRVAVGDGMRGSGLAGRMLERAAELCMEAGVRWMRVDTHEDNLRMQCFLEKHHFVYSGVIYLDDGARRLAFDRLLSGRV